MPHRLALAAALLCATPAAGDAARDSQAAMRRVLVAGDLAAAAWAELNCDTLSMDLAVVAELADRHAIAPRDIRPGGDLFRIADSALAALDFHAFSGDMAAVCADLPSRYQGGLADGAVIADSAPPPDLDALPPVALALVVAGAQRRQAAVRRLFAVAAAAERGCGATPNALRFLALLDRAAIDLSDPAEIDRLRAEAAALNPEIASLGDAAWCARALRDYGPDGAEIAGLIE